MAKLEKDRYSASSLVRGLEILKLFRAEQPTLSLAEIANQLGIGRTAPFRLLFTLQSLGYLRQNEETKRYELTPKVLELGFAYLNTLQITEVARPYLEELRDRSGGSAHIGILDDTAVVFVAVQQARGPSTVHVSVGSRLPAHATAVGKILLAFQPKDAWEELLLLSDLQSYTKDTKTMMTAILKELDVVRKQGYSVSSGEFEVGIRSVSAPIFDETGRAVAAVSVAAHESFLPDDHVANCVLPAICDAAEKLSAFYGYQHVKGRG
ncbi:IclR family transcriptional regulator [Brevibacillus brevis]|uniref:IclR family transcriptional regulator n=1 Tax=Brevibacillus brevis TaxID=1393 RepID=A0ABY9T2N0_BREBE|nr:IclR family transcriptional regulator [Brevibacillus brevis]WNC13739.1 IclR family transcriptional regulator [Brevibacillus brevis]